MRERTDMRERTEMRERTDMRAVCMLKTESRLYVQTCITFSNNYTGVQKAARHSISL